jgi:tripeptide aminopeptidase
LRERLKRLMAKVHVAALLESIQAGRVLDEAIAVQQIPAPTFHEMARANYVRSRLSGRRLQNVASDQTPNVYGRLPGADSQRPGLLVAAHTDTVFGRHTDLHISRQGGRVYGPGLGDNSLGVAAMLALADVMGGSGYRAPCDVWFVATAREEGLGDLGGIKAALKRLRGRVGAAIILEGIALGQVYHGGIAVRRLKITCQAQGGHSWLDFGRPSAIHHLMRLGARLADLHLPATPHCTFNIGLIEGGTSINTIAPEATLYLDLRSETAAGVAALERQVRALVDDAKTDCLEVSTTVVGDRPAGRLPPDHWLVQAAGAALDMVGLEPSYDLGSTDANAVLAAGLPAVTVGISRGGNAHRVDEYVEVEPITRGMRQLVLLVLLALDRLGAAQAAAEKH